MKITLVGDSVFDNAAYLAPGELDTAGRLREAVPGDKCVMLAVDGSVTEGVIASQLPRVPRDTDAVFVSTGGNDALAHADLLYEGVATDTLERLYRAQAVFADVYREMLTTLSRLNKPFAVFTVYSGNFPDQHVQRAATAAISVFNDVIYRICNEFMVPVIEMRDICNSTADYANEIEPSSEGSRKIAGAMAAWLRDRMP